jgi:hypothetical protein
LEPLNDGLPKFFQFGMPGFLSKIEMKVLGFSASALVADAAAELAYIVRGLERAPKTDKAYRPWGLDQIGKQ